MYFPRSLYVLRKHTSRVATTHAGAYGEIAEFYRSTYFRMYTFSIEIKLHIVKPWKIMLSFSEKGFLGNIRCILAQNWALSGHFGQLVMFMCRNIISAIRKVHHINL